MENAVTGERKWADKNVFMVTGFKEKKTFSGAVDRELLVGYVIAADPQTALAAQRTAVAGIVPTGVVSLEELRRVVFDLEKVSRDELQALLVKGVEKCHT